MGIARMLARFIPSWCGRMTALSPIVGDANSNLVQSNDELVIQRQEGYDALNRLVQTIDNYNGSKSMIGSNVEMKRKISNRCHFLLLICAVSLLGSFSILPSRAIASSTSSTPLYYCTVGLCSDLTCPHSPVTLTTSTLRACSEAAYYAHWAPNLGPITFKYVSIDGTDIFIYYDYPGVRCCSDPGVINTGGSLAVTGIDVPSVERNLGFKGCPACGGAMQGNPVNISNGNKFADEVDYEGKGSFPLSFHRYYNSASGGDGSVGARWGHTYSRMLVIQNPIEIKLYRDDGEVRYFQRCGASWCAAADETGTLTEQANSSGSQIYSWQYTDENNVSENYDGAGRFTSVTDNKGLTLTLAYDHWGHLGTVSDAFSRKLTLTYNASNQLSGLQLPDGQVIAYGYDSSGNLSTATFPNGGVRTYFYDEPANVAAGADSNLLTGIQDEAGQRFATYQYDGSSRAIASQHANAVDAIQLAYNADGSTTVKDALGAVRAYRIQTVQNVNHLGTVSGAGCSGCGLFASYEYNTAGDFTRTTDFNGNQTLYTIDANHLLGSRVDASGTPSQRTTNFTWNTTLRVPLTRTVLDDTNTAVSNTQWVYNAAGQTLARCDIDPANSAASSYSCSNSGTVPAGVRRWTYTYCRAVDTTQCPLVGLLLMVTGPRTDLTQTFSYSYYMASSAVSCGTPGAACYQPGDLKSVTDALGHVTTIASYDGAGRITRITDANGVKTDMTYTLRGWLATRTVGGAMTTITYTPYGAVASITDPDGVVVNYTYDAAHRLTKITDALGNYVQYTLDAAGNKTAEQVYDSSNTLRRGLSRTFNTLGQLTKVTDGLNNAVFNAAYSDSYDGNGNLIHSADALGIQRKQSYDGLNRLVSTIDNYNGTDQATQNAQSVFAYDALDQLQGISDPDGLSTIYGHDGLGNSTSVQSPDTGTTGFGYDAAGNVTQRTDAKGITSTSTYDVLNRRTATTYADSSLNVAYGFDEPNSVTGCSSSYPVGHLTRIVEAAVTTVYCYDAHGNVTQKRQTQGTATDSVSYSYTLADRLASTLTASGTSIQYNRDGAGRISGVTVLPPGTSGAGAGNVVTSITYLPFGPIASYTLGSGQTVTRTYDANYALTDVVSPALNLHFHRDAMGNIDALGNVPGANPALETYHYDPLYRLTGLYDASNNPEETYTYNKTGDRLSKTGAGLATGTYSYQTGTHRLSSMGNASRVYDDNGNTTGSVIGGETFGYGYNGRNRMTVVQRNGATVSTYTYNALGQRTAKVATLPVSLNQRFMYDEGSQLVGEYGDSTRDYILLGDLPVAVVDTVGTASTISYVHADGLKTPRAVVDGSGNTIWQVPYQENGFGEQQPSSASGYILNLRFPGQYYDAESGLIHNGYRDYESTTGRYIQSDPLGPWGGPNPYSYTGNSPLDYIDPSGLQIAPVIPPEVPVEEVPPEARAIETAAREEAREENMEREYARREATGSLPGRRIPASQFGTDGTCRRGDFDEPTSQVGPPGGTGVNFLVTKQGVAFPIPAGARGPLPIPGGVEFQGGSGGNGLDPRVSGFRFMDPVTRGNYSYPDGYGTYNNEDANGVRQGVNPITGRTVPNSDPMRHIPGG